jgi:hypothetical protein
LLDTSCNVPVWRMNGAIVSISAGLGSAPTSWSIVGTGDFGSNFASRCSSASRRPPGLGREEWICRSTGTLGESDGQDGDYAGRERRDP